MAEPAARPCPDEPSASAGPVVPPRTPAPPIKVVRRRRKAVVPDLPLGSLSQPQGTVPGPRACTDCASTSLTRLVLANPAGVPAVFVSCHDCERSGWYAVDGGHEVTRDEVVTVPVTLPVTVPISEPVVTPET